MLSYYKQNKFVEFWGDEDERYGEKTSIYCRVRDKGKGKEIFRY
jgi:hypothetical protein